LHHSLAFYQTGLAQMTVIWISLFPNQNICANISSMDPSMPACTWFSRAFPLAPGLLPPVASRTSLYSLLSITNASFFPNRAHSSGNGPRNPCISGRIFVFSSIRGTNTSPGSTQAASRPQQRSGPVDRLFRRRRERGSIRTLWGLHLVNKFRFGINPA
jgi:hypothetical protein